MRRKRPAPGGPPSRSAELERLWQALIATSWQCLIVIPADPSTAVDSILVALRSVLSRQPSPSLEVLDGRGASMADGNRLASSVTETSSSGRRVIAFIDPITRSLAGVPLVRAADAVLLVVRVDAPDVESLSSTLSIVGVERVVGSVAVPASG